jgi:hypothetical protein
VRGHWESGTFGNFGAAPRHKVRRPVRRLIIMPAVAAIDAARLLAVALPECSSSIFLSISRKMVRLPPEAQAPRSASCGGGGVGREVEAVWVAGTLGNFRVVGSAGAMIGHRTSGRLRRLWGGIAKTAPHGNLLYADVTIPPRRIAGIFGTQAEAARIACTLGFAQRFALKTNAKAAPADGRDVRRILENSRQPSATSRHLPCPEQRNSTLRQEGLRHR